MRDDTNEIEQIMRSFYSDIPPSPSYITTGFKYTRIDLD